MIELDNIAVLRRLQEARRRAEDRADLYVHVTYDVNAGQWTAHASLDGSPEYEAGPALPPSLDPAAALFTLAMALYREVIALRATLFGPQEVAPHDD